MPTDLPGQARWLRRLTIIVLALLALALGFEAVMMATARDPWAALAFTLPFRLPVLFYMAGIWTVARACRQVERGMTFTDATPALLVRLGWALALGGVAGVAGGPLLGRALRGWGPYGAFDPAAITVGLIGLLLILLARPIAQGVAMRDELDGMF